MRSLTILLTIALLLITSQVALSQSVPSPLSGNVDRPVSAWEADQNEGQETPEPPPPADEPDPDEEDEPILDPPTFFGEELEVGQIVFCLDRSCSMQLSYNGSAGLPAYNGSGSIIAAPNRWQVTQSETAAAIGGMTDTVEFEVIVYHHLFNACFGALQQATPGAKAQAISWIYSIQYAGGTDPGPGLQHAFMNYGNELDMIFFMSDGYFATTVVGEVAGYLPSQIKPTFKFMVLQIGGQPYPHMVALGSLPRAQFVLR